MIINIKLLTCVDRDELDRLIQGNPYAHKLVLEKRAADFAILQSCELVHPEAQRILLTRLETIRMLKDLVPTGCQYSLHHLLIDSTPEPKECIAMDTPDKIYENFILEHELNNVPTFNCIEV